MDDKRVLVCSLRGDFMVRIEIPADFNKADAERLKKFIDFESELSGKTKRRARGPNKQKPHSVLEEIENRHKKPETN